MIFASPRRTPFFQAFLFVFSLILWRASSFMGREFRIHEPPQAGPVVLSESRNSWEGAPEDFRETFPEEAMMEEPVEELVEDKDSRTLYEILGAPATATRAELKKRYIELAKISHPDSQISSDATTSQTVDFNEIAQAWRILGDAKVRKRYDRELRAQAFTESAQRFTNENLERAVPAVASMMDKVAAPFLRRTTATTWAMGHAVAQGVSNENGGLTDAFKKAVLAAQEAGRFIDGVELAEKSQRLEERAQEQLNRGQEIEHDLETLTKRRLLATLHSEDFFLSSDEAHDVLNRLSIESHPSIIDRAMLRNTIQQDIQSLHLAEAQFSEKLKEYEATDQEWNDLLKIQDEAKVNLSKRSLEELKARKALERAQRKVAEVKTQLVSSTNALRGIEQRVRKSAFEMDRVTSSLTQKQEKVRTELKKKVDLAKGGIQVQYLTEDDLTALRRKEIQLLGESKQVARMATRLQSRAEKLKNRAEALEALHGTGEMTNNNGSAGTNSTMMHGQ